MTEPTNKTYDLVTIADIAKVATLDNMDALAKDLMGFVRSIAGAKALVEIGGGKPDDFEFVSLKWTDDGVFKVTTDIELPGHPDVSIQTVLQKDEDTRD